ncbi:hypothetical protein ABID16_002444 [Rhizobium aquaticum]|uniref:Tat pathway signal protein n=1 Tax=Rhizobium aquaticum TaxID=1549636 RepID=A0ABV2J041_9HYPH
MKRLLTALAMTTALTVPGLAMARQVTLTANMANYGGNNAFLVVYLTDAQGKYAKTLWMAGGRAKYYRHLTDWYRTTGGNQGDISGITGASVGSGRQLKVTVDLADALLDAGYQLHIDSAVEDMRESPSEITMPLTAAGAGKPVRGQRYIANFQYKM